MLLSTLCAAVLMPPPLDWIVKSIPLSQLPATRFVRRTKDALSGLVPGTVWAEPKYRAKKTEALVVFLDRKNNALLAHGPSKTIEEFERYVAMFDVQPMRIQIKLELNRPGEKTSTEATFTVENNENWTFSSSALEVRFDGNIRINEDGSLTLSTKIDGPDGKSAPKVQTRNGMAATVSISNPERPENDFTWTLTPRILRYERRAER